VISPLTLLIIQKYAKTSTRMTSWRRKKKSRQEERRRYIWRFIRSKWWRHL